MRLRYEDHVRTIDREALKPRPGDEVLYEGVPYIVTSTGMRYVHFYQKDDERKVIKFAPIIKVVKVIKPNDVANKTTETR